MILINISTVTWPYYFIGIPLGLILIGGCIFWSIFWYTKNNKNQGVRKKDLSSFTLKKSTWRQTWTKYHYLIPILLALTIVFALIIIGVSI